VATTLVAASAFGQQRTMEDVQFEPDEANVALLARTGEVPVERLVRVGHGWYREQGLTPRYASVCEGPCSARFEAGEYHFALGRVGGGVVELGPVQITGPSTLRAHYADHHAVRLLGLALDVAGTIAGAIMIAASVHPQTLCEPTSGLCYSHETVNGGVMAGGIGVVVGSVVFGSILATRHDEASLAITPTTLSLRF
jgi:hypothetical protein